MRKIIHILILINIVTIFKGEAKYTKIHTFNFVCGQGGNIAFYYYDEPYKYEEVLPISYINNVFGFDYIFIKKLNDKYGIGFSPGIRDIIDIGGFVPGVFLIRLFPYFFINRINGKIGLSNLIIIDEKNNLFIESGINISFVSFWASYKKYSTYYITFWTGPYIFFGYCGYSIANKNRRGEFKVNHIIGVFFQIDFDMGKYIGEYQNSIQEKYPYPFVTPKVFDPDMQFVYYYFSFGVEYRVGKRVEK